MLGFVRVSLVHGVTPPLAVTLTHSVPDSRPVPIDSALARRTRRAVCGTATVLVSAEPPAPRASTAPVPGPTKVKRPVGDTVAIVVSSDRNVITTPGMMI